MPPILHGRSILISSPTASGKTEAAVAPLYQRHVSFKRPDLSVLYVAPTKALVNDVYFRLQDYLGTGGGVHRYTGDHHDFPTPDGAFLLVSTPEALDSLQLTRPEALESIRAMVVDEVHFIHGVARGQQLRHVMNRIRSRGKSPTHPKDKFQLVAMSATIDGRDRVRNIWCGDDSVDVSVAGGREVRLEMIKIHALEKKDELPSEAARLIRENIEKGAYRKVLVFANSRNEAHRFAMALNEEMGGRKWPVHLHFGILSTSERVRVEEAMKTDPRGICVATSTLELGIDIGDVDAVILLTPPRTVNAYLQRIGRGNRRSDVCQVVGICRKVGDEVRYKILNELGKEGHLDEVHEYERPSVIFQQILSLTWRGMRYGGGFSVRTILKQLGGDSRDVTSVLNDMIAQEHIRSVRGALVLSDKWTDEGDGRRIHTVIRGGGSTRPVIDMKTGDAIADLDSWAPEGDYYLGGEVRHLSSVPDGGFALEGRPRRSRGIGKVPGARGKFKGESRIVVWKMARRSGLDPRHWLLEGRYLTTYGGSVFNKMLALLAAKKAIVPSLAWDEIGVEWPESLSETRIADIECWVADGTIWNKLNPSDMEAFHEPSRYFGSLSPGMKNEEITRAIPVPAFRDWLAASKMDIRNPKAIKC